VQLGQLVADVPNELSLNPPQEKKMEVPWKIFEFYWMSMNSYMKTSLFINCCFLKQTALVVSKYEIWNWMLSRRAERNREGTKQERREMRPNAGDLENAARLGIRQSGPRAFI
jgi:hypothetical protein